jgi:hypothetical protein
MTATARDLLRQTLSPKAFERVRSYWWHARFYWPHLLASSVVRHTPNVQGFPAGHTSELVTQLRSINVFAPTEMCRVLHRHGSDKASGYHNYTTVYNAIFGQLRDRPIRIFELGLGTNNPELISNMGINGRPGASLRGWRELFPYGLIYGADIDRDILFEEDRIKSFYCDQCDSAAVRDLWSLPILRDGMDIIVDDGLHTIEANMSFLDGSLEQLSPGGVYVIEDH